MALDAWTKDRINDEIDACTAEIELTLWGNHPEKMERAKVLISKRMGLRIVLGEVVVKLKEPPPFVLAAVEHFDSIPLAA